MLSDLSDLKNRLPGGNRKCRLALAAAQDSYALEAVGKAAGRGFIDPVLVGDERMIRRIAAENSISLDGFSILDEPDMQLAVEKAVRLVHDGQADILMKGFCSTAQLLKGVLNRDWGLRKGELLSHFALFRIPAYHKLLAISDVAINIAPGLQEKVAIINNSVDVLHLLGVENPKVAVVAAVETVNGQMSATLEAAELTRLNGEGKITGCLVEGPLAFDTAVSLQSAEHKNLKSRIAGDPDLLIMPDIEAGNILYKVLGYFANASVASIVAGATAPIVLTSRSDSEDTKLNSILLATAAIDRT